VRGPILKNTLNRLKIMVEKRWLAVFIGTCALGLAVVLDLFQNMCIVLFLAFVRYQQNCRQKVFSWGLYVCAGGIDILKSDKNLLIYSASYFKNWRFVWGAKAPWRQDWLATDIYFKTCITKPCQVGHRPFFNAQRWLQLLTFDSELNNFIQYTWAQFCCKMWGDSLA